MSDRIALMSEGRIEQLGTPDELYGEPATLTVARFIGTPSINLLPVEIGADGVVRLFGEDLPIAAPVRHAGPATLGLRAEDLTINTEGLALRVFRTEMHGADRFVHGHLLADETQRLTIRLSVGEQLAADADGVIRISFASGRAHLFGADEARIATSLTERAAA
jgi:multiple sugar transport system ATP-binding protein